ncbi:MAG: phosphotransferase [Candidatus Latescibacteria bacterium]|nr:phosphotransferase [Candidatus Latescibacterota bacterium]
MTNTQAVHDLFKSWTGGNPDSIVPMASHGSTRRYFRISYDGGTAIAAINHDRRENEAFVSLSRHFRGKGLPVPEILYQNLDLGMYIEQDLGNQTLYDEIAAGTRGNGFSDEAMDQYRMVLDWLPQFQITGAQDLDFSICYPRQSFDEQSIVWDLNYFKYHFLKFTNISFDEQALEDDFAQFTEYLLGADSAYFMYRDFQSRNVMWNDDGPWFIDYQGGRRGALQYDLASLLQDAKADIPWEDREVLLAYYLDAASQLIPVDRSQFMKYYYAYALIRIMQAFGAYGLRGLHEGKSLFLKSISYAVANLKGLTERAELPLPLPELRSVWGQIMDSEQLQSIGMPSADGLTVHITSFSYHRGIPRDDSGHGGGFTFDCRILPNPGRLPEYAELTGMDSEVVKYLQKSGAVTEFRADVMRIVDRAVGHHADRGFSDLTINFGCTGGRHRSVYFAEETARHLAGKYGSNVIMHHREQEAEAD